ncbi:MAG: DUF2244 domain-containing protein [Gammaproteobacteria bacterium]
MVAKELSAKQTDNRFLIRPNCSLSWKGVKRFYLGMLFVSLLIASLCAFAGAWPVLPFAGLEMLVLGIALYQVTRRNQYWQVVQIEGDHVEVFDSTSVDRPAISFQRAWARIVLERPSIDWYSPRLFIRSHGRAVEIGNCLTRSEIEQLAIDLKSAL